jgi:beta-glucanase (GH16 family)
MTVTIRPTVNARCVRLLTSGDPTAWIGGGSSGGTLIGTEGNDYLYGPGGGSTLLGGGGDDTYFVWGMWDSVVEAPGAGVDTIVSKAAAFLLSGNAENLVVDTPGGAGTGNSLANIIAGGDGAQRLDGAGGADVLSGGEGADLFVIRPGTDRDIVLDFALGVDKIVVGGGYALTSFATVEAALWQDGADAVLELGGGDAIILKGVQAASLTAADFRLPATAMTDLRLTFGDEFRSFAATGSGFEGGAAVWKSLNSWGNTVQSSAQETEYYADASSGALNPFSLRDATGCGVLDITARPASGLLDGLTYTSGLISTLTTHQQTYGYFELRADLPSGAGFWPAFWLLRADGKGWSEIDVMEMLGDAPGRIYTTLHTSETGTHLQQQGMLWGEDLSTGFHTFGLSWRPDELRWFLDGTEVFRAATPADMQGPMYMIANLAVGGEGSWPGPTDGVSSATMSIDYIRAYQFSDLAGPMRPAEIRMFVADGTGASERLAGYAGDDRITGGKGADRMTGGGGADVFVLTTGDGKDVVTDFVSGIDRLVLPGVKGTAYSIKAGATGLVVTYGNGKDTITLEGVKSLAAGDIVLGDPPATGTTGMDTLGSPSSGRAQTISASGGNDRVTGGAGDDWIRGGQMDDILTGGAGRDSFVFTTWDGDDVVTDFVSGTDRVVLQGIAPETVWVNPARDASGACGLEIVYGTGWSSDSVFLVGVLALVSGDIVFA